MNKLRVMVLAAVLAGLFCAQTASAQNITKVSGDGQLVCQLCAYYAPLVVRVTDATGAPQANVTVNWAITSGTGLLGFGASTVTASDGTTQNDYYYNSQPVQFSPFSFFTQSTVTASTSNAAVAFSLTQALYSQLNELLQSVGIVSGDTVRVLLTGTPLTGSAGATGATPLKITVTDTTGVGIPNVSMQLVNYLGFNATVGCAGAAGGEPNAVLTDQNGVATCLPAFGTQGGTGEFAILVGAGGGQIPDPTTLTCGTGFTCLIGPINLNVTAAQPGLIKVIQGTPQSGAPGTTLAPLQVEVDTAAGTPVPSQAVTWTASPTGAVSLPSSTSTDSTGRTSVIATLSSTASGTVLVTATCPACPAAARSVVFTLTVASPVTLTGLQIVSGNNQTAMENATFALPLVVTVSTSNGQPTANVNVQFTVTGPASLSSSSVPTNASGQAQVSVTAGATPGPITVTATAGSYTQTFSLTILSPAPMLTAGNFYNGADFQAGNISPCSIATIIAQGLASGIQGVVTPGSLFGPLPYLLASDAVSFNGTPAPIFNVANVNGQQQITVQVPCEVVPSSSVAVIATVNGIAGTVNVPVLAASPGIFETAMSDGVSRAVAVRPDGSFVSLSNPARRGEIVRAYATGLGVTAPVVGTNATAIPGTDAIVQGALIMGVTNSAGQGEGVRVTSARVAPDLIGVFEIPFQVPSDAATGNNVSFSIGVIPVGSSTPIYSATAKIPIQ